MRRRSYFVGLVAAMLMAASTIILAGPAGAITDGCAENQNPNLQGEASGLTVACTFSSATVAGTGLFIQDYSDVGGTPAGQAPSGAFYHVGEARNVAVTVARPTAGTTAGQQTIQTCATNLTLANAAGTATCPAPGSPPGNLAITAADINHSVEFATSTATFGGMFIAPGTFITAVSGTTVTLSKKTIALGPLCPSNTATCLHSVPATVLVSNGNNRSVSDGNTTAGSPTVTSATAHFCGVFTGSTCTTPSDVGMEVSGGTIPDGATIATVNSQTSVTLTDPAAPLGFTQVQSAACPSCTPPTLANSLPLTINPPKPMTSNRYVTDGTCTASKTLTSASAGFANSDVGMRITFNPPIANVNGARIASVDPAGGFATLISPNNLPGTTACKNFTIGVATKTAPATKDVAGQLAIALQVNPSLSPTSPPCQANKVSGFQIELQWYNPGSYNLTPPNATNFQAVKLSPTSIAQLLFNTSATSFGGFLRQNYTVASSVNGISSYEVSFEFLPVGAGLCGGTGIAETFDLNGISLKEAQNPTNTGGGIGAIRQLSPIAQGTSVTYSSPATVTTKNLAGVVQFSGPNNNACTVNSPNATALGCTGNIR